MRNEDPFALKRSKYREDASINVIFKHPESWKLAVVNLGRHHVNVEENGKSRRC
jgi:hypothetical protein